MRRVVGLVVVLAGLYLAVAVAAWLFQRQLIHLPDGADPDPPSDVRPVTLTTEDGLDLTAWFVPHDDPVSTVLVVPGNAGNRSLRLPLARGLVERGHAVLLLEHRGYGGNPGSPTEDGLVRDAEAARAHLEARDDVDPARIVHLGESLGSAVVASLSVEHRPAASVLRSPFPTLADVARDQLPFLPVRWLLRDRFATREHLAAVDSPVLVVFGGADRTIPPDLSHQVAEVAGAERVEIPGADHNDRALLDGAPYLDAVDDFIRRHVG